ncbi:MAG: STM4014 family protein [Xanthomonadales bacterium]|nr:STM4014 family protein [Xanthomonadales bacterium]
MSKPVRLGLVGNPDNRRIRDFRARWVALGQPEPVLIDYLKLPTVAPCVDVLRLDSPGENAALAAHLMALGGSHRAEGLEHGELDDQREFHAGYCELLRRVADWGLPAFNAPADIATMFDKWHCHQRFVAAGLRRPPSVLAPSRYAQWRSELPEQGRIFLKPLHGSSSSGVCALRWTRSRQLLQSPLSIESGRLYNSLRVRRYESWAQIETILSRLLPQGMIAESWIPKLSLPEGSVDLRILVIAGEARHAVFRQSNSPMTNLHLGNRRAFPSGLEDARAEANHLAVAAAACFPDSLYVGVDVLLDARGRAYIGEVNAYGDLLPGLMHQGEDAYTAIARAYLARSA